MYFEISFVSSYKKKNYNHHYYYYCCYHYYSKWRNLKYVSDLCLNDDDDDDDDDDDERIKCLEEKRVIRNGVYWS